MVIRLWKPRKTWRFEREELKPGASLSAGRIARAWLPYGLLIITVLVWGLPPVKSLGTPAVKVWLDAKTSWKPGLPSLHLLVAKGRLSPAT